jgi:hypothetical protein
MRTYRTPCHGLLPLLGLAVISLANIVPTYAAESPTDSAQSPQVQVKPAKAEAEPLKVQVEAAKTKVEPPKVQVEAVKTEIELPKVQSKPAKAEAESSKGQVEVAKTKVEPPKVQVEPAKDQVDVTKANAEPAKVQAGTAKEVVEPAKAQEEPSNVSSEAGNKHEGLVLFEGRWLKPHEAARLEEARYRKQRVPSPLEVMVDLTPEQTRALIGRRDLAESLTAVLRIGDRLVINRGSEQWLIWKRHSKPTDSFREAASGLRKSKSASENWAPDPVTSIKADLAGADVLAAIAFALHAARNAYPHADLVAAQLPDKGVSVKRSADDGSLTLVALGGEQVKTNAGALAKFGSLAILQVAAGAEPLTIEWTTPPQRLLVVTDKAVKFLATQKDVVLRKREKQTIRLNDSKAVTGIRRYSQGPDYKGWQQQTIDAGGPLGFQMDLGRDEIGPHGAAGDYRRTWILEIGSKDTVTQRQIGMSYKVKDDEKDALSREFLRR